MFIDPDGEFAFVAFAIAMAKGAAISAGFNAAAQLAITGSIDMSQVGTAALSGALMGGLTYGFSNYGVNLPGDGFFSTVAESGINNGLLNASYSYIQGDSSFGKNFVSGFESGLVEGTLKYGYKKMTNFDSTLDSGGEADLNRQRGDMPKKGANVIGNPAGVSKEDLTNSFDKFIYETFPGREGGTVSKALNQLPGMNGAAGFHDAYLTRTGSIIKNVSVLSKASTIINGVNNVMSLAPSAMLMRESNRLYFSEVYGW